MNFRACIKTLNQILHDKNPQEFSSSWIFNHAPSVYRFIFKKVRTELGPIDWDKITIALPRRYQKRWIRYRQRRRKEYENQEELERVIGKHRDKLYVFIAISNDKEKKLRHRLTIDLVRVAQKGNSLAIRELVGLLRYIVDEWLDRYYFFRRWKGAESELENAIKGCIQRYRYTGTFFGYLFKTLEYSAYALKPFYSLDDYLPGTDMRVSETIGQDAETGEIHMHRRSRS
jgi:hypothetical protein